ncbi:fungal trichothecene efflux pump-domain-containing protein [Phaeosphaeriaceae sp. PMI808]|nr:fungal trichothecene efflux pump-domain-containing protein [Phaeosphaeriaceae sp. PMI808]
MAEEKRLDKHVTTVTSTSHLPPPSRGLHHDHIAQEAIGGHTADLGKAYFTSLNFIGTVIISGYLGWVLPANTLALINAAIGPSPDIIWVGISWTAGFAIGFTLVGRLSDIFGRRCLRGPVNAFVLSTSVPFAVFGPPVARALYLNTELQWRWCYILGIIVNILAICLYYFFYHPPTYKMLHVGGKSIMRQLKTLDWLGIFLFSTGLVVFLIGMNWGGSAYPWKSGHVLGALFSGFATLVAFCFWEAYSGLEYPLIPMHLFKNIHYDANVACASLAAIVYYANSIIWPTMINALFTTDVTQTGWLSCAVGGGLLTGQILAGFGLRYIPRTNHQMTLAALLTTSLIAALAASTASTRTQSTTLLLLGTIAAGYIENLTLSATALLWDPADIGLVTGVMGALRTALAAVATSMYSSILATQAAKWIPRKVVPAALAAGLPPSSIPALLRAVALGGAYEAVDGGVSAEVVRVTVDAVKEAYAASFRVVFLCTVPFGVVLVGAAVASPDVGVYLTDEVARRMHGMGEKGEGEERSSVVV